jgi:hypothetical protein
VLLQLSSAFEKAEVILRGTSLAFLAMDPQHISSKKIDINQRTVTLINEMSFNMQQITAIEYMPITSLC